MRNAFINSWLWGAIISAPLFIGSVIAQNSNQQPNILFILVDDQRSDELGCAGDPIIKTPHIDSLSDRGVRFENAFVTTSICAASRASILTGLTERTHGYTFGKPPISGEDLSVSYPVLLRGAGYRAGFFGKFGVKLESGESDPGVADMFDEFESIGGPSHRKMKDGTLRHSDEVIGDRAVEFVESQPEDQPFCLSLSFNIAHARDGDKRPGSGHFPWPQAADGLYEDGAMPEPRLKDPKIFEDLPEFLQKSMNRDRYFWRWDTPEKYDANLRARFRMLTGMDGIIGRVLEAVDQRGFSDNTVVIYTADNGYYRADRGFAGKWSHFEQSLRVPLIIYDPRLPEDKRGRVEDAMALNIDLPATMLDLAGVSTPDAYQGSSLKPFIDGDSPAEWRDDLFCEHLMGNRSIPMWEGVRGERYKYACYFTQNPAYEFLHDLEEDPDELINLVKDESYASILEEMRTRCAEYVKSYSRSDRPVADPSRNSQKLHLVKPDDDNVFLFNGAGFAKIGDTGVLAAADDFAWQMEVKVDAKNRPGAVLMGNRVTPGKPDLTFMKITAKRGVQFFGGGAKKSVKLNCELPTDRWIRVEVRKEGQNVVILIDGETAANGKLPFPLPAMPVYLGGDPNYVSEAAHCEIRNASIGDSQ
ncbi:MAG: sulfatase-like hydrolase/transferase [Verrucomicrobiota bacterium]